MELKKVSKKFSEFVRKYRFVAIILLAGLLLMCLPGKNKTVETSKSTESEIESAKENLPLDQTLCDILSRIDGAGEVQVLLTLQKGEETVFQTDSHTSVNSDSHSTQIDTVIISGSDKNEYGLVRQINAPVYMGAIVVCQGGDSPKVRLAIVDAVSKVTGLGANQISVLKMK